VEFNADSVVSLVTLTLMESVLGIDNVVFIAILAGKLPAAEQGRVRKIGLLLALVARVGLLFCISWLIGLTAPLFALLGHSFSGRDLILLGGGLFLIVKATHEIYAKLEVDPSGSAAAGGPASFGGILAQILVMDVIFSLDSVITAVGMASRLGVMIAAMVLSMLVMLFSAGAISDFVNRHPSVKILALSFLLLIGVMLTAEGMGQHIQKGYIYSAMAFSVLVELLNMRLRKKQKPVALHTELEGAPGTKIEA
jgi:predicted tellurium resistance membrane protein TerC